MSWRTRSRQSLLALMLAVSGLTSPAALAQDSDFQTWTALLLTGDVSPEGPVKVWFDGHVRRGDVGTTLIVRPGAGVQLAPWVSIWAGYAWVPVVQDSIAGRNDEHRAWQQVILSGAAMDGRLKLQARTRFEQRFGEGTPSVGLRLRQFARVDYRSSVDARIGAVLWDEVFFGLNDPGFAPRGFDQNRVFLGPAFYAFDGLRVEAGYLWAHLRRPPRTPNQHALALNFFTSF